MITTIDEIQEELKHWSFMPGWRFELIINPPAVVTPRGGTPIALRDRDMVTLRVHSEVPDATAPDQTTTTVAAYPVPLDRFRFITFDEWLRQVVHNQVINWADEWLRRDGLPAYDLPRES